MAFVEWKEEYETGIAGIDAQHRQLVGVINALAEAMKEGKAKEELAKIINEMTKYAIKHFSLEERYFREHGYPEAEAHLIEHHAFEDRVQDFTVGFREGRLAMSLEIMTFLGDWLVKHINGSDKAYVPHLIARGVR